MDEMDKDLDAVEEEAEETLEEGLEGEDDDMAADVEEDEPAM